MTEQVLDMFEHAAQPQDNSNLFQIAMMALLGVVFASVFLLVHIGL